MDSETETWTKEVKKSDPKVPTKTDLTVSTTPSGRPEKSADQASSIPADPKPDAGPSKDLLAVLDIVKAQFAEDHKDRDRQHQEQVIFNERVFSWTKGMALVSFGQFCILLWYTFSTASIAESSKTASQAAQNSAETSSLALAKGERGYLSVNAVDVSDLSGGKQIIFKVNVGNLGHTPILVTHQTVTIQTVGTSGTSRIANLMDGPSATLIGGASNAWMAFGTVRNLTTNNFLPGLSVPITDQEVRDIKDGRTNKCNLRLRIKFVYKEAFGKEHTTPEMTFESTGQIQMAAREIVFRDASDTNQDPFK